MTRDWLPASHHMMTIFAVVAVVSALALGLLSWQLFDSNRRLEAPRRRGALEGVADSAIEKLTGSLAQLEEVMAKADGATATAGVSFVTITPERTIVHSTAKVPFVPTLSLREADAAIFTNAVALEFSRDGSERARIAYEALSKHSDLAVRATALQRLAALRRQSGDLAGALRDYDAMSPLDDVGVGGLPAGLIAAVGRANVLREGDRKSELRDVALRLAGDISRGRWPLTAAQFEFYGEQASEWLGTRMATDTDAVARAKAVEWLWRERATLASSGRRLISHTDVVAVVVWHMAAEGLDVAVGGPDFLAKAMSDAIPAHFAASVHVLPGQAPVCCWKPATATRWSLMTMESPPAGNDVATRVTSDAVPWTTKIWPRKSDALPSDGGPQWLLFSVMGVMAVVLGAGWYFIARARGRELRVARLQNDFVAAVSHEFRSPLTSLAHISELLAQNRMPGDARRQQAYGVLVADTARLRELVEHLLDFGRFDSGEMSLRFEPVGIDAMVKDIVDDARQRVAALGYTIEFSPSTDQAVAEVDRVALGRAIWNLIDNAVKYSPDCRTVWVTVEQHEGATAITVRDKGLGIPSGEQADIFERFVRGEESKSRRIKGTGIGLALVRQIVGAHGGEIELTSTVGEGSRFVVKLRAAGGAA